MCWENAEQTRLEELPLERFNVEEIPLEGEVVEEHAGFTDVFFYTDLTNPYAGYVLNLQKLKAYNRLMFPLAMALNREPGGWKPVAVTAAWEQTVTAPDLIICPLFCNERQIGGHSLMASGKVRSPAALDFPETDGCRSCQCPSHAC